MKTLRNVLACAVLLACFAACTDDFATLDDKPSAEDEISLPGDTKPTDDATAEDGKPGDESEVKDDASATANPKPGN